MASPAPSSLPPLKIIGRESEERERDARTSQAVARSIEAPSIEPRLSTARAALSGLSCSRERDVKAALDTLVTHDYQPNDEKRNAARVPDTVGVVSVDPTSSEPFSSPDPSLSAEPATAPVAFSPDGKWLALPNSDGVRIYDVGGDGGHKLSRFLAVDGGGVSSALFSPGSKFLATYTKPPSKAAASASGGSSGAPAKNLHLWRVSDGTKVLSLSCRSAQPPRTESSWPLSVVGEGDERAYHLVTNAVNVYDLTEVGGGGGGGGDGGATASPLPVFRKLPLKGVAAFSAVAPPSGSGSPPSHLLAAAVPEAKGSPGSVGIWEVDSLPLGGGGGGQKDGAAAAPALPRAKRALMRATTVDLRWCPDGAALLAFASTDSDSSNKSYYGDAKVHYLKSDGTKDCLVPLPKEGPVHDVAWSPRADCFVVLAGFMPPRCVAFDAECSPKLDLGTGPFCHARWSPHDGRFLCLAGFGNLAGDLAFYDRKADGKLKPCGSARASGGVSAEWSPDGRYLLVSTTAPRLRVDNGVRLFKYNGELVAGKPWDVLLEAAWRPSSKGVYPDRPPTPRAAGAPSSSASASGATSAPSAPKPAPRPTAFVPPHLRGKGAPPPRAAKLSLGADDDEGNGTAVRVGAAPKKITSDTFAAAKAVMSRQRLPPGAEAIVAGGEGGGKAAAKNAKRRAAAAKKKAEAEAAAGGVAGLSLS